MHNDNKNRREPAAPRDERAFLGEEFLTWLWWRCDSGRAEFEIGKGENVGVALDEPLLLKSGDDDENGRRPEQIMKFGRPLGSLEAAAALARGKRLARAKLILGDGTREWNCTFDAETFTLRGIRVPEADVDEDTGDSALERASGFEQAIRYVDAVFGVFLADRVSPEFRGARLKQMKAWAREKTTAKMG
ncbi:MAG: hypothetical protein HY286_14180 [Planctomycetes bacterium]|nr:hypothetical protein [Planctomycetota bacterium]